jgi:hypothetical protein
MADATKDDQATQVVYTGIAGTVLDGWTKTVPKTTDGSVSVTETYSPSLAQANNATWQSVVADLDAALGLA